MRTEQEMMDLIDYNFLCKSEFLTIEVLKTNGDNIDLLTDFDETITSIQTGYGLMRVLENLTRDVYA